MVEISGQVKDAETKKSLEFCTISVFNKTDSLITGAVSDEGGYFSLQIPQGVYSFKFSFIGYETDTLKKSFLRENKFLGVFKLKSDAKFLKEVSIKSSSNENLIDREVQIVTDKMRAGTTSTKEVLDKMSGVDYDRYTNAIKVDNSTKIIILVDGMEKDQDYIKNISPDRLKKIEVIRDPSGRYALEGYTAVINIILRKDYKGTEVLFANNNLFDLDASKSENIFVQNYSSITINHTNNKLNLYTKINTNLNSFNLNSSITKEYPNDTVTIEQNPVDGNMNVKVRQMYNNIIYGADYTLNPKNSFSFEGNLSFQPISNNSEEALLGVSEKKNGVTFSSYELFNQSKSNTTSSYYSLFYDGKTDEKNSFKANITYSNYFSDYDNNNFMNNFLYRNEIGKNIKNKIKFYAEYYHTFNDKHNIQFGYGNSFEELNNKFEAEQRITKFSLTDFRNKIYSYYSYKPNKKFGVKLGLAAETSNPKTDAGKLNYFIYLPYADVKYKLSNLFDFKLKYRSNSEYPDISQVNPFESRYDNQTVRIGNPKLKPEVTHRLSLETNIMGGFAKIEPYYHFSNNYITEFVSMKNDTVMQYSFDNVGNYSNYGLRLNFTIPFGKSIFWQNDFDFYNTIIEYKQNKNKVNDFTMNSQLVYVNEKSGFVGGAKYQKENRKYLTAMGYNMWNNDYWLLFVQKPFFKQRLSVMCAYLLPITYGVNFNQGTYIKTVNYIETRTNDVSILKNFIVLEISYRFNKGKTINKKEKEVDVKNEKTSKGIM